MEQGKMSRLTIAVLFCTFPCLAIAETIDVGSFNLESGGANISTLEQQIEDFDGIDIWGYSEVLAAWEDEASDASFVDEPGTEGHILGTTGGGDRLLIVYDDDRFTLVDSGELRTSISVETSELHYGYGYATARIATWSSSLW